MFTTETVKMFVVIHFWENTFVVQTFCSRVSSRVRLEVFVTVKVRVRGYGEGHT